jgi:hypothetical protein
LPAPPRVTVRDIKPAASLFDGDHMAKRQTRRSVSILSPYYEALAEEARRRGVSMAALFESMINVGIDWHERDPSLKHAAYCIDMPIRSWSQLANVAKSQGRPMRAICDEIVNAMLDSAGAK